MSLRSHVTEVTSRQEDIFGLVLSWGLVAVFSLICHQGHGSLRVAAVPTVARLRSSQPSATSFAFWILICPPMLPPRLFPAPPDARIFLTPHCAWRQSPSNSVTLPSSRPPGLVLRLPVGDISLTRILHVSHIGWRRDDLISDSSVCGHLSTKALGSKMTSALHAVGWPQGPAVHKARLRAKR